MSNRALMLTLFITQLRALMALGCTCKKER